MEIDRTIKELSNAPQVNFLVGQVMKKQPTANPQIVREAITEKLILDWFDSLTPEQFEEIEKKYG